MPAEGPIYSHDPAQEELEIEFNSRYDYVREAFAGTEETGDDWTYVPTPEEIEAEVAEAALHVVPGDCTPTPWLVNVRPVPAAGDPSEADDIPF
jgi:hypothetical protein